MLGTPLIAAATGAANSSLVYINTLMLQHVLREPAWIASMTTDDVRGLTPLIYPHVNPTERLR